MPKPHSTSNPDLVVSVPLRRQPAGAMSTGQPEPPWVIAKRFLPAPPQPLPLT
ncbi:hypothetical protein L209DRAFT_760066 [Thermothelomyces heterothallicus CBS 203.75]